MRSLEKFLRCYKKHVVYLVTVSLVLILTGVVSGNCFSSVSRASDLEESYKYYKCYMIQNGDTMWSIAKEHRTIEYASIDVYLEEVYEINKMGASQSIIAGHTLILPYYDELAR